MSEHPDYQRAREQAQRRLTELHANETLQNVEHVEGDKWRAITRNDTKPYLVGFYDFTLKP